MKFCITNSQLLSASLAYITGRNLKKTGAITYMQRIRKYILETNQGCNFLVNSFPTIALSDTPDCFFFLIPRWPDVGSEWQAWRILLISATSVISRTSYIYIYVRYITHCRQNNLQRRRIVKLTNRKFSLCTSLNIYFSISQKQCVGLPSNRPFSVQRTRLGVASSCLVQMRLLQQIAF